MRNNPFNQFRFADRAVCKTPAERFKFVIRTGNRKTVYLQKTIMASMPMRLFPSRKGWFLVREKARCAALGDKPAMQRYYFISVDTLYEDQFANALNAAMCLSSIPSPAVITSSAEASANSTVSVSVIGVKVKTTFPVGTSSGTLIHRLTGMSTG